MKQAGFATGLRNACPDHGWSPYGPLFDAGSSGGKSI